MSALFDERVRAQLDAARSLGGANAGRGHLAGDGVTLVRGSDLRPQPILWLWPGWLALGKLHILAGAPGQGKTTIALKCAATVTAGGRWPDGSRCAPGNVPIASLQVRGIALGRTRQPQRQLRARADLQVKAIEAQHLSCVAAPEPGYDEHAVIIGWPAEKQDQKKIALELSRACGAPIFPPA